MLDLYEFRILVESDAAMLVAQRATDEEIHGIVQYAQLCATLIAEGKDWSFADREFHASIARATHNSVFHRIIPSIHQSAFLAYNLMDNRRNEENSLQCHAMIADNLVRRDGIGAALAVRYHLQRAIDDLNKDFQKDAVRLPLSSSDKGFHLAVTDRMPLTGVRFLLGLQAFCHSFPKSAHANAIKCKGDIGYV